MIEKLIFEDAACTDFYINYTEDGNSFVKTVLVITARHLAIGDAKMTKRWNNIME